MKKFFILSTFAYTLLNFRGDMMKEIVRMGYEVIAAAPESENEWAETFAKIGVRYCSVPLDRTGTNPLKDVRAFIHLYRLFRCEQPDILFAYQAKSIVYGCVAARLAGVKNIYALLAGLGSIFQGKGLKGFILKSILVKQYRFAFSYCRKVFFQNKDDINDFVRMRIIQRENAVLINGSGVNLKHFVPQAMPSTPVFLYMGRLLRDKGVVEYMEAARSVKKRYPNAQFHVLGAMETNPMALKMKDIEPYITDGSIAYLGETNDVRPFLKECSVFVLPSYREGTSRAALEAMATGRPLITTDVPGCRETVVDGVNGFLVPVKNIEALAEKMVWMIKHPAQAERMGQESLRICREKYNVDSVNKVMIETMQLEEKNKREV